MILKKDLILLQQAIKIYDRRAGKQYLISYRTNKNHHAKVIELSIREGNFWHLVGCKVNQECDGHVVYQACLEGKDVSESLSYTRRSQDLKKKADIFCKLFDFIENAKILRIASTENAPEAAMFCVGAGTVGGLIGYDKVSKYHIPKTTQEKSIFALDKNASDKIFLVLSKSDESEIYDVMEYSISKDHAGELCAELMDSYRISEDLCDTKVSGRLTELR